MKSAIELLNDIREDTTGDQFILIGSYFSKPQELADQLLTEVTLKTASSKMRLEASLGKDYTFSGRTHKAQPIPSVTQELIDRINYEYSTKFNSAHINYYADGRVALATHKDDEPEIKDNLIACLSLGELRELSLGEGFFFVVVINKQRRKLMWEAIAVYVWIALVNYFLVILILFQITVPLKQTNFSIANQVTMLGLGLFVMFKTSIMTYDWYINNYIGAHLAPLIIGVFMVIIFHGTYEENSRWS